MKAPTDYTEVINALQVLLEHAWTLERTTVENLPTLRELAEAHHQLEHHGPMIQRMLGDLRGALRDATVRAMIYAGEERCLLPDRKCLHAFRHTKA